MNAQLLFSGVSRRLKQVTRNAQFIASGIDQAIVPLSGTDEIARLDESIRQAAALVMDAHRKQTAVLANATDVLFALDEKGKFLSAGETCIKAWGYSSDYLLHRSIFEIVPKAYAETLRSHLKQARQLERTECDIELLCAFRGETRFANIDFRWNPKSKRLFCVARDVTERRMLLAEQASIASAMRNILQEPLAQLRQCLEQAASAATDCPPVSVKQQEGLQSNLKKIDSLLLDLSLTNEVRDLSFSISLEKLKTTDVVQQNLRELEGLAKQFYVKLKNSASDLEFFGDRLRVSQILQNLISNAIKFSPEGAIVEISDEQVGEFIEMCVTDQGPGIALEDQPGLFDKYSQLTNADSAKMKGTGLGLSIAKLLAEAQNGTISVRSDGKNGSCFIVRFPALMLEDSSS
jgi:two-component system sensor histidine kinase VicK